ncbi:MAG: hypothetical protein V4642_04385 [Bacteroidota bacterium]
MSSNLDKQRQSQRKKRIIVVILFFSLIGLVNWLGKDGPAKYTAERKDMNFSGRVIEKFVRRAEHIRIVDSNGRKESIAVFRPNSEKISIGDYVIKKRGTGDLLVIKKDSSLILEF